MKLPHSMEQIKNCTRAVIASVRRGLQAGPSDECTSVQSSHLNFTFLREGSAYFLLHNNCRQQSDLKLFAGLSPRRIELNPSARACTPNLKVQRRMRPSFLPPRSPSSFLPYPVTMEYPVMGASLLCLRGFAHERSMEREVKPVTRGRPGASGTSARAR